MSRREAQWPIEIRCLCSRLLSLARPDKQECRMCGQSIFLDPLECEPYLAAYSSTGVNVERFYNVRFRGAEAELLREHWPPASEYGKERTADLIQTAMTNHDYEKIRVIAASLILAASARCISRGAQIPNGLADSIHRPSSCAVSERRGVWVADWQSSSRGERARHIRSFGAGALGKDAAVRFRNELLGLKHQFALDDPIVASITLAAKATPIVKGEHLEDWLDRVIEAAQPVHMRIKLSDGIKNRRTQLTGELKEPPLSVPLRAGPL